MNRRKSISKHQAISGESRYAMADDGEKYDVICHIMGELGYKMTRSSARNYVIAAGVKIVQQVRVLNGQPELPRQKAIEVALSPSFQSALKGMMEKIDARKAQKGLPL
jgi:hypothetical protein